MKKQKLRRSGAVIMANLIRDRIKFCVIDRK